MFLHIPTLFVALFLAFALFGVTLTLARPFLPEGPELRLWEYGTWAIVAGFLALASRAVLPEWVAVVCGNSLVFASLLLFSQALHRFVQRRPAPRWQAALAVVGALGVAAAVQQPLHVRTGLASLLYAAQIAPMVWLVRRHGWRAEHSLRTVAITLALTVLALVLRAGHALTHPAQYADYFQASLGNGLTYLASYLFPLGAGFGFVLANLERAAARLQHRAAHDSLTSCLNRGSFVELLAHAVERARRDKTPLSLVLMDLDEFKRINDRHGHLAGDAVLRAFAAAARQRLRASDVLGRLGGEEFALLLPATDQPGAWRVAEALREGTAALAVRVPGGPALGVTVSLGVSTLDPGAAGTSEELFAQADRALYASKHAGRNRVTQSSDAAATSGDSP
jgi:diguanylate cyclase (GGDEF)-like protein